MEAENVAFSQVLQMAFLVPPSPFLHIHTKYNIQITSVIIIQSLMLCSNAQNVLNKYLI